MMPILLLRSTLSRRRRRTARQQQQSQPSHRVQENASATERNPRAKRRLAWSVAAL